MNDIEALNEKNSLCKPGFEYYNGSCYYFSTMIKSWSDASSDCGAKMTNLAIINNQNEFNYISSYAKTKYMFSLYVKRFFLKQFYSKNAQNYLYFSLALKSIPATIGNGWMVASCLKMLHGYFKLFS